MKIRRNKSALITLFLLSIMLFEPFVAVAQTVDLVTDAKFNPNDIISDEDVTDVSMSLADIQAFLDAAGGKLARYSEASPPAGEMKTAAQIIWQAAQDARINPEIILAMLEKEQSLLDDVNPSQYQLDWAVGYSKCDGCTGVPAYKGFGNQVRAAATRIRYFLDNPGEFQYKVGLAATTKDGFLVAPQNQATANLYIYNPYRGGVKVNDRYIGANFSFYKVWKKFFAPNVAAGAVVRERESNTYYLIGESDRKPFVAPEVVTALYSATTRDSALVVPRRKLSRFYPLIGAAVTLADVYAATLVDSSLAPLWAGSDGKISLSYKNIGSKPWMRGDVVVSMTDAAGVAFPEQHDAWIEPTVGVSFEEDTVKPGEVATFSFPIFSKNVSTNEYIFRLKGRADDPAAASHGYAIAVSGSSTSRVLAFASPYQADVKSFDVPASVITGSSQRVTLVVKNTGNVTWKKLNIRLSAFNEKDPGGAIGDYLNPKPRIEKVKKGKKIITHIRPPLPVPAGSLFKSASWRDKYRIGLMNEKQVKPGEVATFTFSVRAPVKIQDVKTQLRFEFVDIEKPNAEHRVVIGGNPNYEWTVAVKRPTPVKKAIKKSAKGGSASGGKSAKSKTRVR